MIKKTCVVSGTTYVQKFLGQGIRSCGRCVVKEGTYTCRELVLREGCPMWTCWERQVEPGVEVVTKETVTTVREVRQHLNVPMEHVVSGGSRHPLVLSLFREWAPVLLGSSVKPASCRPITGANSSRFSSVSPSNQSTNTTW